jgi:hypothetical protein
VHTALGYEGRRGVKEKYTSVCFCRLLMNTRERKIRT